MTTGHRPTPPRSRGSHLRTKIFALLLALAALWTFAAVVTVRDGLNVLFVGTLDAELGRPTEALVDALQQERRQSAVAVGEDPDAARADGLADGRAVTDDALAEWRDHALGGGVLGPAVTDELRARLDEAAGQLGTLATLREEVDAAALDHHEVVAGYTDMIEACLRIYGSMSALDDVEIAHHSTLLVSLTEARELVSRQDSLVAGALATGGLTDRDRAEVVDLVATHRFLYERTVADLPPEDVARYRATVEGDAVSKLRRLEDQLVTGARSGAASPFSAEEWTRTTGAALASLRDFEFAATEALVGRASSVATGVVVRLVLAGGLGLVAVVAAVVVSVTTARSLLRQLERLRDAARELAERRLPRVVARLSAGEEVDVAAEAPPLRFGDDVIGQVGQAFNAVQQTAVRAAVQQAELRHGVRDVFLSLARRTQNLVHRQLRVLDEMERRQTDADEVADLFRVDHLATRMRRNAENLIVLSGAAHGRAWRQPVPMIDVVRGALAEVEDYTRVTLLPVETGALEGRAVGDVIHLLAELIENAVAFSPPYAAVTVSGQRVAHGFVVEIEDRGLGMSEEDLAAANRTLADPPDFSVADPSRLGHYVVAKLARRHGVTVHLRRSPYGGIIAIVLIPGPLVSGVADDDAGGREAARRRSPAAGREDRTTEREDAPTGGDDPAPPLPVRPAPAPAPRVVGSAGVAPSGDPPARTPSGLPWRVRQASLPPQLRDEADDGDEAPHRDPELVRRMMDAYQHGTRRGRTEAAGAEPDHPGRHLSNGAARPRGAPADPTPDGQEE